MEMAGKAKCSCGGKMTVPLMKHATMVVKRTCPKCGGRWQFVVKPMGAVFGTGSAAHSVEGFCLSGGK